MRLLERPGEVRGALAPLRRRLLARLATPASATELAGELRLSRQKVNYHLRKLEDAGLVELAEERRRRGFVERVLRAKADTYVIDPSLMTSTDEPAGHATAHGENSAEPGPAAQGPGPGSERYNRVADRHAADHLVAVASSAVRDVTRMQSAAGQAGRRLLTFTLETEVRLAEPADLHHFTEALADAVAEVVARFDSDTGRRYRVIGAGHPAPRADGTEPPSAPAAGTEHSPSRADGMERSAPRAGGVRHPCTDESTGERS
ncbi:winged helix-turn-helix domain-containing protein [Sphaerisporangium sp. TRM90804]|uniref:ArsR/SmtB family transcription factor n=1 Tax=Sphaerisporangium sp. TRM90804 TaxID=3031113 RepID=UPI00244B10A5|nr:winged helix-turn-helix domain-containing protein [Sphaerisporangium sp. TRM90804]MDH2427114.1 winged helix-turn-helix domain-containing protein [Sphaerisporangium sp. TRM90804]